MFVVFGATGSTGPGLVQALVAQGHTVRVASRDLARVSWLPPQVERVQADLADPSSLAAALEGAVGVYAAIGGPTGSPRLPELYCGLIDAARAAGVDRFVHLSGIDAHRSRHSRIQRWHGEIHRHLAASGMARVTLAPTFFLQNFLGLAGAIANGVLPMPTGDARTGLIDARDISEVAARVLTTDRWDGRILTLTGPELLSHADVAAVFGAELGRSVQFVDVPGDAFRGSLEQAGLPPWFADLLTDVYVNLFAAGHAARLSDDVEAVLGRRPRTCATFVRDHRDAFALAA